VLLNKPGRCTVQYVEGKTLPVAKRTLARANCRVGKIRRGYGMTRGRWIQKGRVISQGPTFGAVLPGGSKVDLVVSRGRKPS
jgi:beta-lactam-binding protein with PASTA domain